ncbi:hypothetical protein ACI3PL_21215, partial [Lacticaseibacillus paracasei]
PKLFAALFADGPMAHDFMLRPVPAGAGIGCRTVVDLLDSEKVNFGGVEIYLGVDHAASFCALEDSSREWVCLLDDAGGEEPKKKE